MSDIQISVIIPHYNSPDKLARLLSTIPVVPEFEVIVVDDMSTSGAELLADVVEKEKVRRENFGFYVNLPDNKGGGGARNVGLDHAVGKWLMFADADDWYLPCYHETVKKYYDTDADIVYFSVTSIREDNGKKGDRHYYTKDIEYIYSRIKKDAHLRDLWFKRQHETPWGKMIRRAVVADNDCRFDVTICSNDIGFSARAAYFAGKIIVDATEIYVVSQSPVSLTTNHSPLNKKVRADSRKRRNEFWKSRLTKKEWLYVNTRYNPLNFPYHFFVNINFDKGQKLHRKIVQKLTWGKYAKLEKNA